MQRSDKDLIIKRFSKGLKTYGDNAVVQKQMASELFEMLLSNCGQKFENVFEFGCGSGSLTKLICDSLDYRTLRANDIVSESEKCIKDLSEDIIFCAGDIEALNLPQNSDLIISNATIQWVEDFEGLIEKFSHSLKKNGVLCFSTFGKNNFREISGTTAQKLNYKSLSELEFICSKYFDVVEAKENTVALNFETPKEVLKHIKKTGTNALSAQSWTKRDLNNFIQNYPKVDGMCTLTYHPMYFLLQKK